MIFPFIEVNFRSYYFSVGNKLLKNIKIHINIIYFRRKENEESFLLDICPQACIWRFQILCNVAQYVPISIRYTENFMLKPKILKLFSSKKSPFYSFLAQTRLSKDKTTCNSLLWWFLLDHANFSTYRRQIMDLAILAIW